MQVKQLRDAKPYEAPNHRGYCSLRLFGLDAGGPKQFTVGLSYFLPGGGAGPDASPTEKVYYVLAGELTLDHRRARDRAQGRQFLLHRAEREPRDHQSRQRGRHHAGGGVDAAEVTVMSEQDLLQNPLSLFDIRGRTAIVTGATGAFGALASKVLAGAGANVVICANNAAELEKVAAQCRKLGGEVVSVAKRPSSEENCNAIVQAAVDRFGGVDILVVASGQNKVSKIVDQKPEDFLDVMDANVTQSWLIARAAGRRMLEQGKGGKVILMSSARGLLGHPAGYSAYCASKSAVDGITKALGCEWGGTGITVNALGPTVFRSPLTQWMFEDSERARGVRAGFITRVPKGRLGEPSDLAGPLLFLASKASDFYTGHILYADGGYTAG